MEIEAGHLFDWSTLGDLTDDGWSAFGPWTASGGYLTKSDVTQTASINKQFTDDDLEVRLAYRLEDGGTAAPVAAIHLRHNPTSGERLLVTFREAKAELHHYNGSSWILLDADTAADSTLDTWYEARIVADGASLEVWWGERGDVPQKILETSVAPLYDGDRVTMPLGANIDVSYDDIRILADGLSRTTTYAYAASGNNELQSMTDYNGATTFTYDDWGRTATEAKNGVTKTYSWTMANMLEGVDSDDAGDTDVSYTYRGDLKRVWRWEDGNVLTNYNWGAGFNVVSEEDIGTPTTLARTYIAGLAEIVGSNPATGTPRYLTHDHLGSTRGVFSGSKASLGTFEYTPYGNPYAFTGPADITRLFTGHDLDPLTGNYFAPFRYLDPDAGRWLKQDPLGMVDGPNMYGYVGGNPINYYDPYGLAEYPADFIGPTQPGDTFCEPPGGPTVPPRDGRNGEPNSWVPSNPSNTGNRGTSWKPKYPTSGSQPRGSWSPTERQWDIDDGRKNRERRTWDGTSVDHWNKPIPTPPPKTMWVPYMFCINCFLQYQERA